MIVVIVPKIRTDEDDEEDGKERKRLDDEDDGEAEERTQEQEQWRVERLEREKWLRGKRGLAQQTLLLVFYLIFWLVSNSHFVLLQTRPPAQR